MQGRDACRDLGKQQEDLREGRGRDFKVDGETEKRFNFAEIRKGVFGMRLFLISLVLFGAIAFTMTDYKCVRDCQKAGYSWGYCQSICSYEVKGGND